LSSGVYRLIRGQGCGGEAISPQLMVSEPSPLRSPGARLRALPPRPAAVQISPEEASSWRLHASTPSRWHGCARHGGRCSEASWGEPSFPCSGTERERAAPGSSGVRSAAIAGLGKPASTTSVWPSAGTHSPVSTRTPTGAPGARVPAVSAQRHPQSAASVCRPVARAPSTRTAARNSGSAKRGRSAPAAAVARASPSSTVRCRASGSLPQAVECR
jgi:hypothetical protein